MYSLQMSVTVSSPSSSRASSRTGSSLCHGQGHCIVLGDAVWPCPWLCKDSCHTKTAEWVSRGLGSTVHSCLCCSLSVCPPLGKQCWQHCPSTPFPAVAPLWGAASVTSKGMCTNPALPKELPCPEAEGCVSFLFPLGSVPLSDSSCVRPPNISLEKCRECQG